MKHTEVAIKGFTGTTVEYPNSVVFMYSPQPVIIRVPDALDFDGLTLRLTVIHSGSMRSHTEDRVIFGGLAMFDISRIMQLLAPDVDDLFQRLDSESGPSLSEGFSFTLHYLDGSTATSMLTVPDITAMYGALDQGEVYGATTQRRLWRNFPQTFNLWQDSNDNATVEIDGKFIIPEIADDRKYCHECNLQPRLSEDGINVQPGQHAELSFRSSIQNGQEFPQYTRRVTLVPDDAPVGSGTYLRWLNRRGEVSYWLFQNSETRTTSAVGNSFRRFYEGDPGIPVRASYVNPQKADYREARELVLGAIGLSRDEYEDLCSLATSPLVEMLTTDEEPFIWQRVTVAAGSFARNIRRQTPNRQDLEIIIELPERNTIKL